MIEDGDGDATELWETIADDRAIDPEAWFDAKTWLLGCPKRLVEIAHKGLKVVCGSNTSYLEDGAWVTEKIAISDTCEVRVSPNVSVSPNLGGIGLAEALARVIPFVAGKKDERPVLKCIRFAQKRGEANPYPRRGSSRA